MTSTDMQHVLIQERYGENASEHIPSHQMILVRVLMDKVIRLELERNEKNHDILTASNI